MKGSGCPGTRYHQDILLQDNDDRPHPPLPAGGAGSGLRSYISPAIRQDYEPPNGLAGLLFKFTFFDNWNDGFASLPSFELECCCSSTLLLVMVVVCRYYIGLDRLEFLDSKGEAVDLTQVAAVDAVPHSLRDIIAEGDAMEHDPRTPQQLIADLTQMPTLTQMPCWLCPLSRCMYVWGMVPTLACP